MKAKIFYEWCIETVDSCGDILDLSHSDKCPARLLNDNESLVLVRDVLDEDGNLEDRSWAYVENGKLPFEFSDSAGRLSRQLVPARFHIEFRKTRLNKNI